MKKLILTPFLFAVSFLFILSSCGDDNDGTDSSTPPTKVEGRKVSIDYNYSQYDVHMDLTNIKADHCDLTGMTNGATRYIYQKVSDNEAALTLTGKQILTTNTYTYFWEMTLTYKDAKSGTLRGTYMSKNNFVTAITGSFKIE